MCPINGPWHRHSLVVVVLQLAVRISKQLGRPYCAHTWQHGADTHASEPAHEIYSCTRGLVHDIPSLCKLPSYLVERGLTKPTAVVKNRL
jgi:hypothetical protein